MACEASEGMPSSARGSGDLEHKWPRICPIIITAAACGPSYKACRKRSNPVPVRGGRRCHCSGLGEDPKGYPPKLREASRLAPLYCVAAYQNCITNSSASDDIKKGAHKHDSSPRPPPFLSSPPLPPSSLHPPSHPPSLRPSSFPLHPSSSFLPSYPSYRFAARIVATKIEGRLLLKD